MDQHQDVAQLKDIKCSTSEILGAASAGFIARLLVFELWNCRPQKDPRHSSISKPNNNI
jgi:hypothetical protein